MAKNFHIPSLDGIRAVAFLIVFIAHSGAKSLVPGGFGVTVFFFLSGYLITTLLRTEFEQAGDIQFRNFYVRRIFRIFPGQYFVFFLALALCFNGILPGQPTPLSIAMQFFQLTNYLTMHGTEMVPFGTGIYWSLSVEEHFYFVFPLVLFWLLKKYKYERISLYLFFFCLLVLAWRLFLVATYPDFEERIYRGTDTRIDSILYGCILALWNNPFLDTSAISKKMWIFLLALAIPVLLGTFFMKDLALRESVRYTLQGLALIPFFYTVVKYPNWWIYRPLNWKWLTHIGVLSYSLYLVHYIVIYLVNAYSVFQSKAANACIALCICLVCAQLLHVLVEKPCIKWRKRFLSN